MPATHRTIVAVMWSVPPNESTVMMGDHPGVIVSPDRDNLDDRISTLLVIPRTTCGSNVTSENWVKEQNVRHPEWIFSDAREVSRLPRNPKCAVFDCKFLLPIHKRWFDIAVERDSRNTYGEACLEEYGEVTRQPDRMRPLVQTIRRTIARDPKTIDAGGDSPGPDKPFPRMNSGDLIQVRNSVDQSQPAIVLWRLPVRTEQTPTIAIIVLLQAIPKGATVPEIKSRTIITATSKSEVFRYFVLQRTVRTIDYMLVESLPVRSNRQTLRFKPAEVHRAIGAVMTYLGEESHVSNDR